MVGSVISQAMRTHRARTSGRGLPGTPERSCPPARPSTPGQEPRRVSRWAGWALAVALVLPTGLGVMGGSHSAATAAAAALSADGETTVLPPTETVSTPDTDACPRQSAPAVAEDTSEAVPTGSAAPSALPVPNRPVGGDRLGTCGFAVPQGTSRLPPDISAAGWLIADLDTGDVLAAKDPHGRYRPASTLKLLTMNVLLRGLTDLDRVVVGTDADTEQEGSRVGIGPGGRYTVKQLMLFLMMGSGNDVANALARANGGAPKTLAQMNARARELGAFDTRAATVSGLDGPGQMTSVYDLALLARADMALAPFPELISTRYSQVPGFGDYPSFGIANDNQLLFGYPGALGGKTGFTDAAGNTYVGMAQKAGRRLVVTLLKGTQQPRRQWMQAASLLDWGFGQPNGTTPVGRLVASGAEATAAPATASIPSAPTRATLTLGGGENSAVVPIAPSPTAGSASAASANDTSAATGSRGTSVIVWVLAVLLGLLALLAVVLGLRGSGRRTGRNDAGEV